ncbi:hypothetical protein C8A05DRAFT_42242 [Staphylotrichum tortipilum]|uniref:PH domain-containing protein n=1 Tax=Staphylotrichum tortipilum TaxID=2831512 RepID=A0AAN6MPI9_9PEZI|nr:hypothetical protein C8A05DRAFT_42242 [Staphylotrichum longicolle]
MGRNRVLSFIAQFSAPHHRDARTPTPTTSPKSDPFRGKPSPAPKPQLQQQQQSQHQQQQSPPQPHQLHHQSSPGSAESPLLAPTDSLQDSLPPTSDPPSASSAATTPSSDGEHAASPTSPTPPVDHSPSSSPARASKRSSRPLSMVQTYQPPVMAVNEQTLPELQPIFTLLNSHSNKLYQEGYFLKLDDQDSRGKPNPDRTWIECFAQLVGTVLSLWDAAELDAAGEDGEVLPKFINLTDASIKMIESLPTKSNDESPLQNILSISTAGRNRYLLHFNSHHSLIQWTSGIRLAMYEHSTLQEAYTGALVAGKGKTLNNINIVMERARQPVQEWVRVRFGAGVPWRRCFCVIEPPNEKEYQKAQKEFKKRNPYDRSHGPILKGDIKFYDSKKEAEKKKKHQRPIASITDAYSAYAIYPQAKELIDTSTLLKIEGDITIHSDPPSSTEGFVFIMPETHPAVSGFEMLLRTLFPTWDTFALYGRPGRLVASSLDNRSLMFAMPKQRRYGYLEVMDVSSLILTDGSPGWSEREWRKRLKELTGQRMAAIEDEVDNQSRSTSRNSKRLSYGAQNTGSRPKVGFADDGGSVRSSRSMSVTRPGQRNDSAPPDPNRERAPSAMAGHSRHSRHISDTQIGDVAGGFAFDTPSHPPPAIRNGPDRVRAFASDLASTPERVSSEDDSPMRGPMPGHLDGMRRLETPEPVTAPPAFAHSAGSRPQQKPNPSPEMRRATNRLSNTTLSQLARAGGGLGQEPYSDERHEPHYGNGSPDSGPRHNDHQGLAVQPQTSASAMEMNANINGSREVLTSPTSAYSHDSQAPPPPLRDPARKRSNSPLRGPQMDPRGNHPPPPFRPGLQGGPPSGGRRTPPPGPNRQQPFSPVQGGSPPIHRKPLPTRTTSLSRDQDQAGSPMSPQQSPPRNFAHPGAGPRFGQPSEFTPRPPPNGQRSAERVFDDASSTASPDYASTRRSSDTQESADRPRAGVLKVVGDGGSGASSVKDKDYDIPEINFGRTLNYGAPVLPGGSSTSSKGSQGHPLPAVPASGRKSPGLAAAFSSHSRQQSDDTVRRSIVWPGPSNGPSAENLASLQHSLQPRAPATALYTPHQRVPSSGTLTDARPTHSRHSSADLLTAVRPLGQSHSRHSSTDLLATGRPPSQGAGAVLSGGDPYKRPGSRGLLHSRNSSGDLLASARPASQGTNALFSAGEASSYLSAREQEHVARVTGSPLIAFASSKGPSQTQNGLVGAINARERERAQMRQGIGGQAVAQAIDQRQREQNQQAHRAAQAAFAQQQHHQQAQQQAQFAYQQARPQTPGGMSMGLGMDAGYGPPMMQARPQTPGGMSMMPGGPAPSVYAPSMVPGMNVRSHSPGPGVGMMSPRQFPPQQQQQRPPPQGAGWGRQGPPPPSPGMGVGMGMGMPPMGYGMQQQGGRPQSPALPPPQGQFAGGPRPGTPGGMGGMGRPGTPGGMGGMMARPGTPGTPGRMQMQMGYQGQAF